MVAILKLVILPFLKRYVYHTLFVGTIIAVVLAVRGCINEHDRRIEERATRNAHITRDSIQIAALRDSLVLSRETYDSTANALRAALRIYSQTRNTIPAVEVPSLINTRAEYVPADVVIELCADFIREADNYKRYADSTIVAQERIIENFQPFNIKVVEKSSKSGKLTAFLVGAGLTALVFSLK